MFTVAVLAERVQLQRVVGSEDGKCVVPGSEVNHLHAGLVGDLDVEVELLAIDQLQEVLASRHAADERVVASPSQDRTESVALLAGEGNLYLDALAFVTLLR